MLTVQHLMSQDLAQSFSIIPFFRQKKSGEMVPVTFSTNVRNDTQRKSRKCALQQVSQHGQILPNVHNLKVVSVAYFPSYLGWSVDKFAHQNTYSRKDSRNSNKYLLHTHIYIHIYIFRQAVLTKDCTMYISSMSMCVQRVRTREQVLEIEGRAHDLMSSSHLNSVCNLRYF